MVVSPCGKVMMEGLLVPGDIFSSKTQNQNRKNGFYCFFVFVCGYRVVGVFVMTWSSCFSKRFFFIFLAVRWPKITTCVSCCLSESSLGHACTFLYGGKLNKKKVVPCTVP